MRVKVETVAPLPHIKAWFSTHAVTSILDLKTSLCTDLPPLAHERVRPQDILLLLDDFELLDASPIDVVHDGDLVVIKKRPGKRKASLQDEASPARKRTKTDDGRAVSRAPQPPAKNRAASKPRPQAQQESSSQSSSESSSDSEDSDEGDTDSDSDSDSDSDASSSSSSSSTSSTSSAPAVEPSKRKQVNGAVKAPATAASANPPIPPGFGKPTTHSRNLRRRRKKMYERLSLTAEPASVNDIPLGERARTDDASPASSPPEPEHIVPVQPAQSKAKGKGKETVVEEHPAFLMASLQNKNKRRGFKHALTQGVPAKILFSDAPQPAADQSMDVDPDAHVVEAALAPEPQRSSSRAQPRLVPPSEKQERGQLPANMFVTSVDVEEGLWPVKGKKKKKKKAPVKEVQWDYEEEEQTFAGGLPYDDVPEVPAAVSVAGVQDESASTERVVVAARWDTLRKIADKEQVQVGTTVAWKALGINFATFTPEVLLHVGRVAKCDEELVVELLAEPGSAELSFGGAVEEEGGVAEETFPWPDVLQGDWRLVSAR